MPTNDNSPINNELNRILKKNILTRNDKRTLTDFLSNSNLSEILNKMPPYKKKRITKKKEQKIYYSNIIMSTNDSSDNDNSDDENSEIINLDENDSIITDNSLFIEEDDSNYDQKFENCYIMSSSSSDDDDDDILIIDEVDNIKDIKAKNVIQKTDINRKLLEGILRTKLRSSIKKALAENTHWNKQLNEDEDEDYDVNDESDVYKKLSIEEKEKVKSMETQIKEINDKSVPEKVKILLSDIPLETKAIIIKKLELLQTLENSGSEYKKLREWLDNILKIPFGKYCKFSLSKQNDYTEIGNKLYDIKNTLDKAIYGQEQVKEALVELVAKWVSNPPSKGHALAVVGPAGCGKCHGKNTPILMYDGKIKMVQDIKEGDLLMGIDSKPRKVLGLGRGEDEMYEISNVKGDTYTVNSEHILCLKISGWLRIDNIKNIKTYKVVWFNSSEYKYKSKNFSYKNKNQEEILKEATNFSKTIDKNNEYLTISVKEYLKLPKYVLKKLKGYKVGVEFPEKEVDLEPYALGYWLGDGTCADAQITTQEKEVVEYFQKYIKQLGGYVHQGKDSATTRNSLHYTFRKCEFKNYLRKHNLIGNKHIPHIYKCNSRENRLKLLAGLIDSDGYYNKKGKCYEIIQKNSKLSEDIVYLCRSLGFACYSKKCKKSCMYKGEKREGEYNRIYISGNGLEDIPVLCLRKEAEVRKQIKDALCSQISVKCIGRDKYYGFELDGDHKYLLDNFIVTHNTTLFREGLAKALDRPFASFSLSGMSDESYLSGFAHTYEGSDYGRICRMLTETGCMNPIIFMDELDKIDTTRHGSSVVNKIMEIIDFSQNHEYEDMYFGNIKIDLSRVLFVFSLNHIDMIDPILRDRLEVIKVKGFEPKEKVRILKDYIIPKELKEIGLNEKDIIFPDNIISFIIRKIRKEEGVREGKRAIQIIIRKINLLQYVNNIKRDKKFSYYSKNVTLPITITEKLVNKLLIEEEPPSFLNLYC
jgi:ATP-dependent Lon protease